MKQPHEALAHERYNNRMEAEMKEKNLSRVEYALFLSARDAFPSLEDQLIAFIKNLMMKLESKIFPGWNLKQDTLRRVQLTIFWSLHELARSREKGPFQTLEEQGYDFNQLMELRDEFIKRLVKHGANK